MREEVPVDGTYGGFEEENSLMRSRMEEKPGGDKFLNMTHYSRAEDHFGDQQRAQWQSTMNAPRHDLQQTQPSIVVEQSLPSASHLREITPSSLYNMTGTQGTGLPQHYRGTGPYTGAAPHSVEQQHTVG